MKRTIAFIGAGSHADAVYAALDKNKYQLVGYFDDKGNAEHDGFPVIGKISDARKFIESGNVQSLFITIGDNYKRKEIFDSLIDFKDKFINIISDKSTIVFPEGIIGRGVFVGANAFLGSKVTVSDNTIINTGSIIEHHSRVGANVNVAPNATINGLCTIEECCYIGSSSTIIQLRKIKAHTIIGAGAVVIKDILYSGTYVGVPAHRLIK